MDYSARMRICSFRSPCWYAHNSIAVLNQFTDINTLVIHSQVTLKSLIDSCVSPHYLLITIKQAEVFESFF